MVQSTAVINVSIRSGWVIPWQQPIPQSSWLKTNLAFAMCLTHISRQPLLFTVISWSPWEWRWCGGHDETHFIG